MRLAPLRKTQTRIQQKREINDTNLALIDLPIPTILLKTPLTLFRPRHTNLLQTPLNHRTTQTRWPFRIQRAVALGNLIESILKNVIYL